MNAPMANTHIDPNLIMSSTHEARNHDIVNFLERAYSIDNFLWSKTSPRGTVLATYRFPDKLLAQAALNAKTRNFFGLRAGVEFTVLVNKQQFQAGNLLISYLPNAKYNPSKVAMSNVSLTTRTGQPRTNLDLMDATKAVLTVPYASPFIYYNLLTGDGTIGDFQISVYSPLTDVADAGTVSVQVFARFVDVDLEFPTGSLPTTFSSIPVIDRLMDKLKGKPNLLDLKKLVEEGTAIMEQVRLNEFKFQMNSENISVSNFKPRALPNMAVSNISNNSHIMSLSSSNVLPSTNQGQASNKETMFQAAVKIPCYHDNFPISNQSSGINVWSKIVSPLIPASTNTDGSLNVDYVYFHTQPHSKWRGSLIYHFRAVKTTFHSVRIRVWFSPASVITDVIDKNAVYSKIVDLKDTNNWTFEVPFIWPHPFLNVHQSPSSLGTIGVDIINKMVFPSTVADNIDIIVERSAGQDFDINLPTVIKRFPFDPTVVTAAKAQASPQPDVVRQAAKIADPVGTSQGTFSEQRLQQKFDDLAANIDYLGSKTNLKPEVKKYISNNISRFKIKQIDLLDTLSKDEPVGINYLGLTNDNLAHRISIHDELRKKRDLTQDGDVESNPGPFSSFSRQGASTASFTLPTIGNNINSVLNYSICNNGGTFDDWIFQTPSGDLRASMRQDAVIFNGTINLGVRSGPFPITINPITLADGLIFQFVLAPAASVSLTATDVNVVSSIPLSTNTTIVSPNPLQVNVASSVPLTTNTTITSPLPLPTTGGGGGGSSIVATTSVAPFLFQMKTEQDNMRRGFEDVTFHRPVPSARADSLTMGQSISSVEQMIGRSSSYAKFSAATDPDNFIQVLPHAFGIAQKDSSGLILTNGTDILSYYANSYAYARGGINLRIVSAPDFYYNVILDPDSNFYASATEVPPLSQQTAAPTAAQQFQLNSPLQQVVKPSLEGFGEVSIPFYSDSFMYSISPSQKVDPSKANADLQLPYTQLIVEPNGAFSQFHVYRAACADFEFSYLNGPPILLPVIS
jgi:hypothetical protein